VSSTETLLVVAAGVLALYIGFVVVLVASGRRQTARALAGLIPDCIVLFRRLLVDGRVPRRIKLLVGVLIAYLTLPFDIVPDFIPVAGQLDDAVIVGLLLGFVLRGGGTALVREHWPGPQNSLALMLRLAGRPAD
jgi:uncharacterized membrane protein YkvA (DUF1232 family)